MADCKFDSLRNRSVLMIVLQTLNGAVGLDGYKNLRTLRIKIFSGPFRRETSIKDIKKQTIDKILYRYKYLLMLRTP